MATVTEQIPDVIAYLLAQARTNTSLGAATPVPVVILDGPVATDDAVTLNGTGLTQRLWIGSDGYVAPGTEAVAATSDQGFAFIDQARTRENQIEVQCAAEAISGDTVMSEARNAAFSVMAAIEVMLRGSPPFGPGDASMGGLVQWSEIAGPIELTQQQGDQGAYALVKFRVSAVTRLTS